MASDTPSQFLTTLFHAAVESADPLLRVPDFLPDKPHGNLVAVGAGKASARMAEAVEKNWHGPLAGYVVTRYGHCAPCKQIQIAEASHPTPDHESEISALKILDLVSQLTEDDHCLALISGGGSSLLCAPVDEITIDEKKEITSALLTCGASIDDINCVRKHLSKVKGGRLALAAASTPMTTLVISDVPGDDPSVIASGPTVADPTTLADAQNIILKYGIDRLPNINQLALKRALTNPTNETLKPDSSILRNGVVHIIATPQQALESAASSAIKNGVKPLILSDSIQGEAQDVGKVMAGIAFQVKNHGQPITPPCVLLSGGETTVTVRGDGRGGRNVEFLLSLAIALKGANNIYAIAADTDGIDGIEEIAGAVISPDTLKRALDINLHPEHFLQNNDAHTFFEKLGDQVITGPTLTNVNDFRAILIT